MSHPNLLRGIVAATLLALAVSLLPALVSAPAAAEQSDSELRRVAAASLAVGGDFSCVVTRAGRVRCWGGGWTGQLGYGDTESIGDDETPASAGDVRLGGIATAVATGYEHACALLTTGRVRCWGAGWTGQLGYGDTETVGDDETPASVGDVPLGGRAVAIAAGEQHTCALLVSGGVRCWGAGWTGQLGYGDTDVVGDDETPASVGDVPLGGRAVAITVGVLHTCAVTASGGVRCWGSGSHGRLGYGNTDDVGNDEAPASYGDVPLGARAVAVTAGETHTCALTASGRVRCWGSGESGRLGYGTIDNVGDDETPASVGAVPLGRRATALSAGGSHTCALLTGGAVRCWGDGYGGRLGYGNTDDIGDDETPAGAGVAALGGAAVAVSAGDYHTCAVRQTGSLRCWGDSSDGRLGYVNDKDIGDDEPAGAMGAVPLGAKVRVRASTKLKVERRPKRDRRAPYVYRVKGTVAGPFVADRATCTGRVKVLVKKRHRTLLSKRTKLRPDCRFAQRVKVTNRRLRKKNVRITRRTRLKLVVKYTGSPNLQPATKVKRAIAH